MGAWPNTSSNLFKTSSFFLLMFLILESVLEFCFLRLHAICYKLTHSYKALEKSSLCSLWLFWEIFVQKVLGCKYQLQMSLNDLLDIKRPQKVIKRPKKAMKVVKAKSKARSKMV